MARLSRDYDTSKLKANEEYPLKITKCFYFAITYDFKYKG